MHSVRKNAGITQLTLNLRPEWDVSGQPNATAALPLEKVPPVPITETVRPRAGKDVARKVPVPAQHVRSHYTN